MTTSVRPLAIAAPPNARRFAAERTVPLLYLSPLGALAHGSGVLLRTARRFFIATAAHLLDRPIALDRIALPGRRPSARPRPIGAASLIAPADARIDVALIELHDTATIARLQRDWRFLPIDGLAAAPAHGRFFLAGYPFEYARHARGADAGLFVLDTWRVDVPQNAAQPVDPAADLFFACGDLGSSLDGRGIVTPALEGASGAGVWLLESDSLRLVAVQCAFRPSQYFRATGWAAVLAALRERDGELANELHAPGVDGVSGP
ncbi:MAG TPA: hypothetical protein VM491_24765 [Burkholderiaceae bacterium]|nr:hypothetical protein [Burkholderiaceae bacterium]